jgi:hypothetical protein
MTFGVESSYRLHCVSWFLILLRSVVVEGSQHNLCIPQPHSSSLRTLQYRLQSHYRASCRSKDGKELAFVDFDEPLRSVEVTIKFSRIIDGRRREQDYIQRLETGSCMRGKSSGEDLVAVATIYKIACKVAVMAIKDKKSLLSPCFLHCEVELRRRSPRILSLERRLVCVS